MEDANYVRGLQDGIEIVQDVVNKLLNRKMPVAEFKSQLLLEVRYFAEKARGKRLDSLIQTLES